MFYVCAYNNYYACAYYKNLIRDAMGNAAASQRRSRRRRRTASEELPGSSERVSTLGYVKKLPSASAQGPFEAAAEAANVTTSPPDMVAVTLRCSCKLGNIEEENLQLLLKHLYDVRCVKYLRAGIVFLPRIFSLSESSLLSLLHETDLLVSDIYGVIWPNSYTCWALKLVTPNFPHLLAISLHDGSYLSRSYSCFSNCKNFSCTGDAKFSVDTVCRICRQLTLCLSPHYQ